MNRKMLLPVIAVLCGTQGATAQDAEPLATLPAAILPPALPWSGASEQLIVAKSHPWITPAERSDFATTPRYDETWAWLERLWTSQPTPA